MFRKFDFNNEGLISYDNFQIALNSIKNKDGNEKLNKVFLNQGKHKKLNYSEFVELALNHNKYFNESNLEMIFKIYDVDNTNKITIDNLKEIL